MNGPLDVLVLETLPYAADEAVDELGSAGHRVHRCHELPSSKGLCVGLADATKCPVHTGVDVALLVRPVAFPYPTPREGGVTCAVRARVPVIEDGPDIADPFAPVIAGRVTTDLVTECEAAAAAVHEPLRHDAIRCARRALRHLSIDGTSVDCTIDSDRSSLRVLVTGPPLTEFEQQQVSVRVFDAVRSAGRTHRHIDVAYRPTKD